MSKPKKPKLPDYSKAVKLIVCNKEKYEDMHRYMVAGLLVSKEPLPNIPVDDQGVLVLEAVDLVEDYPFLHLTDPIFRALGNLPIREVKEGQGRSVDQFLLSLRHI